MFYISVIHFASGPANSIVRKKEEVNCCAVKKGRKTEYKKLPSEELKKERKVCLDQYEKCQETGRYLDLSHGKSGKELMTQDELAVMDGGKCIFMLRGVRPFLSDKYDLTRHPNYKYTSDADPKNVFDMERYIKKQRAVVKPGDHFDVYEIDVNE